MQPARRLSMPEFIALMGMMFATVAFSIDAMLPAMGEIADELSPDAPNRAQLIITSFVLGMGLGTLLTGPLSDSFGRKTVILCGAALYIFAAILAWAAPTLEFVLLARVLQGLGAAGPRVAALAIVRDLYEGRRMAQVMSFAMLVFTLVPAIAPLMGAGIIWLAGWRGIFVAFVLFAVLTNLWLGLRQPETLAPENRRPFRVSTIASGIAEVFALRQVVLTMAALSLAFGVLFTTLSTTQQVFDLSFDAADSFPYWFAVIALLSGTGSLLNARIVIRLGMRRVVRLTFATQLALSALMALITAGGADGPLFFALYVGWTTTIFFMAGLTIGNLNALGMEPLGHLAGLAASIIGSVATVAAVLIAVPIGLAFDGTPLPLALGSAICCALGIRLMHVLGPGEAEAAAGPGLAKPSADAPAD
ncbi:MAG: multidrug effflux MFS transporter [Rhodobacter sp.]|nr:multidrug effflux MFS transporter [Rhodobacter sp.]